MRKKCKINYSKVNHQLNIKKIENEAHEAIRQ